MSDANVRGRLVWHELLTTDTKAAAAFYKQVAGWGTKGWPQDPSSYTLFVMKNVPRAGLMILPQEAKAMGAPPNWMSYVGTPDVDETARMAAQLGGRVLRQPADIPTAGRFAVLADPQGAAFAAFTPSGQQQGPSDPTPGLGDFSWHELATNDWQSAFDFYRQLFGWEKTESMDMGAGMGVYQMFGFRGRTLGGMYNKPANVPGPPYWLPYIKVPDAKRVAETTKRLGGRVVNGPMEVPGGDWITAGIDPQGAVFAVHSAKPAAKKAAAKPKKAAAKKTPKRKAAKKQAVKKKAARKPKRARRPARRTRVARRSRPRRPARRKAAKKKAGARRKRR